MPRISLRLAFGWLALLAASWRALAADAAMADLYSDATLVTWRRPAYPPDLVEERREGVVWVRFIVDEKGAVTKARVLRSFDSRANQAAVDAVRAWTFTPALAAGKAVASCMNVPVAFRLKNLKEAKLPPRPPLSETPRAAKTIPPDPYSQTDPEYPSDLADKSFDALVRVRAQVDERGKVTAAAIVATTEPKLNDAVLAAVRQWEFEPARQGDLKIPGVYETILHLANGAQLPPGAPVGPLPKYVPGS